MTRREHLLSLDEERFLKEEQHERAYEINFGIRRNEKQQSILSFKILNYLYTSRINWIFDIPLYRFLRNVPTIWYSKKRWVVRWGIHKWSTPDFRSAYTIWKEHVQHSSSAYLR